MSKLIGRLRNHTDIVLLLIGCLMYGFVLSLSSLAVPLRTLELSDSPLVFALVVATFPLAGATLSLASGVLADWFGRQRMMLGGFALFCVGFLVLTCAVSYRWLLAGQLLLGLGDVMFWIAAFALLADLAPPGRQHGVQGLGSGMLSMGAIMGPLVAGYLAAYVGFGTVFLVGAMLSLAGFIMVTCMKAAPGPDVGTGSLPAALIKYHMAAWNLLTRNRRVLWAAAVNATELLTWPVMGGSFYLMFLTETGFSPSDAGSLRSAQRLVAVLAQLGLAKLPKLNSMARLALLATAVGGLTVGATPLLGNVSLLSLVACLGGVSAICTPALHGFVVENVDRGDRSMWFALYNLIWALVRPTALLAIGIVVERASLAPAFFLSGAFVTVSAGLLWVWARKAFC
jgi:MFS family permease